MNRYDELLSGTGEQGERNRGGRCGERAVAAQPQSRALRAPLNP